MTRDILVIDDWFIWVWCPTIRRIREYVTEVWPEWLDVPEGAPVSAMVPFLGNHRGHLLDYTFDDRDAALRYIRTGDTSGAANLERGA